eukprot:scaffold35655_cov17-Tisochrysis_lutea.AAC.1
MEARLDNARKRIEELAMLQLMSAARVTECMERLVHHHSSSHGEVNHHHSPCPQEEASRLASQGLHPRHLASIAQATAGAFCDAMLAVLSQESGGLSPQHTTHLLASVPCRMGKIYLLSDALSDKCAVGPRLHLIHCSCSE